jgi:hypothetical protein
MEPPRDFLLDKKSFDTSEIPEGEENEVKKLTKSTRKRLFRWLSISKSDKDSRASEKEIMT